MTQLTQPDGQTEAFPTTSWTVATVLSCALQVPNDHVTAVEVQRSSGAFEEPLLNADVVDPMSYDDPNAPGALPIISANGDSGQSSYNRPLRGPDDRNPDNVTIGAGPITILVWVNTQPLKVTPTQHKVPGSMAVRLSATVRTADGAPVPASSLKWQWSFQDGTPTSHQASPQHTSTEAFYDVIVVVTDPSQGTAGTATIPVTTPNKPAPGKQNQAGGHKHTHSKSPTGNDNGSSNQTPGTGGSKQSGNSNQNPNSQSSNATTTPTTTAAPTTSTPATPTTSAPTTSTPATTPAPSTPHRSPPKRTTSHKPAPSATGPLVTGRLIADVTPLPEKSSPLVRVTPAAAAPAPTVRQATSVTTSPWTAIGAGLAVAALLALGAWHELRGRRRSRPTH